MNIAVTQSDIILASPMIAIFLASLLPITIKVLRGNQEQAPFATISQALVGLFIAAALLVIFVGSGQTGFGHGLRFDGLTQSTGLIAIMSVIGSLFLLYENPATSGRQLSELIFLLMSSVLGMLILTAAVDLLLIFVGVEMMSLSLYLMIAMSHEQKISKEAAIKYFVLGSFASAIFLYGVAMIYGATGTTNILQFVDKTIPLAQSNKMFLFGLALLIVGFAFKVSVAPFQAWTPDVYQGAPTPITTFMATAVKAVSFCALIRIILTRSLVASENLFHILQWLAVITMLVGNLGAILQSNLKRLLAYSSVAHSGYILVGVITAGVSENWNFGVSSVVFYLFGYSLMTIGSFAIVGLIERSEDSIVSVDDLAGLAKKHPVIAFCFSIFLLSLAGIPPTLGFFGKFYLFNAAIGQGLLWLAIWGVINSVISVYYYLRVIVVMYMVDGEAEIAHRSLNATKLTLVITALLVAFVGIMSGSLFETIRNSLSL